MQQATRWAFVFWVGWRYVRRQAGSGSREGFVSFVALIAMLGMMLGVAALITVLSVMNGFQEELRGRILAVMPHVEITADEGVLHAWEHYSALLMREPGIQEVIPFVRGQALILGGHQSQGAMLLGLPSEAVAKWEKRLQAGALEALQPGSFRAALGVDLARALGVGVGDAVVALIPDPGGGVIGFQPRIKTLQIAALLESGMYELDATLLLLHLNDAQALFRTGNGVHGLSLSLAEPLGAARYRADLARRLPQGLWLSAWSDRYANLFRAVQLEKTMMTLVLFLIVAVAAFNLVATLVMSVQMRKGSIAILRTLGATPALIAAIFLVQGFSIGLLGVGLGAALGVWLAHHVPEVVAFIEWATGLVLWSKEIYLLSEIPSRLLLSDLAVIVGGALLLTLAASLYPSLRATQVLPAQVLRYE